MLTAVASELKHELGLKLEFGFQMSELTLESSFG
jgi:hypothetical protein